MAEIKTTLSMADNISSSLSNITNALNLTISAFQGVHNTASQNIGTDAVNSIKESINSATVATQQFQNELNSIQAGNVPIVPVIDMSAVNSMKDSINSATTATQQFQNELNSIQPKTVPITPVWDIKSSIDIFQNTGLDRMNLEMGSLNNMLSDVLTSQQRIGQQALNMDLLPPNASWDINATNQRIAELGQKIADIQNIDISTMSDASIVKMNSEYESMRASMNSIINLQENMNTAIQQGDLSSLNASYTQLNGIAEQVEMRVRSNMASIAEMNNIEWKTPQNIEIFDGAGLGRYRQEIGATNNMLQQLTQTQQQITQQANSMRILPPQAHADLTSMGSRVETLRNQIEQTLNTRIQAVGFQQANSEMESLRQQLNQAIQAQESLNNAMSNMDISAANAAYNELNQIIDSTEREIQDNINGQSRLNDEIARGTNAASGFKKMIAGAIGLLSVKAGANAIQGFIEAGNSQVVAEQQLANVLANQGASFNDFDSIRNKSNEIQSRTMHGSTSMIGGAAELGTYIADSVALESMMDTLSNYAAGMSGGAEVSYNQMVNYATQLGKAFDGSYDGLRKKGFELNDVQKQIIETGTDMEKALVIDDVISQSWAGLAEQMAQTPQGIIASIKNSISGFQTDIGMQLLPVLMVLFTTVQQHLPQIEQMMHAFVPIMQTIIHLVDLAIQVAFGLYDVIASNWSAIEPIVLGLIGVIVAYNAVMMISAGITAAVAAAKGIAAMAQSGYAIAAGIAAAAQGGLNAALMACPLTWIVAGIIAVIGAIYLAVNVINKFADTSISATGIISGAFFWLGSVIANIFMGLLEVVFAIINSLVNPFIELANFIANVFENPISSIIKLFEGMADIVLEILEKLASAMDFIFGSNMASTVSGWRDELKGKSEELIGKYAPEENYREVISKLDLSVKDTLGWERLNNKEAFNAGYQAGEKFEQGVKDLANITFPELTEHIDKNMFSDFDGGGFFDDMAGTFGDIGNSDAFDGAKTLDDIASSLGDIGNNTSQTAKNTANISEENLKYWRDIAERDAINRFTTARVNVEFKGGIHNTVNNDMDLDSIVDYIAENLEEAIEITTEKVVYA